MSLMTKLLAGATFLVLAGLGAVFLLLWKDSRTLTNPAGYGQPDPETFSFLETPQTVAGLPFEDVSFAAPSGDTLRGWIIPSAEGRTDLGVVAFHGRGGDRRSLLPHLRMLHEEGAGVLLFDFRENGLSDGASRGTGLSVREADDGISAVKEMRRLGYEKVVVMGCSLGASAAILAAAADKTIDGVIAESAIARFEKYAGEEAHRRFDSRGMSAHWLTDWWGDMVVKFTRWRTGLKDYRAPQDVISEIAPRPVLLIHGGKDPWVVKSHAHALREASGNEAELFIIDGAGHCDGYDVAPQLYQEQVASFLRQITAAPAP